MQIKTYDLILACYDCDYKYEDRTIKQCANCNSNHLVDYKSYNLEGILSFNQKLKVIISPRDLAKSHKVAEYLIKNYQEHKRTFLWIKRWKTETTAGLSIFNKFGYEIDNKGVYELVETGEYNKKGEPKKIKQYLGTTASISTASRKRGTQMPNHKTIWWDEYGAEDGRSIKNELNLLWSFQETYGRNILDSEIIVTSNKAGKTWPLYNYLSIQWDKEWTLRQDKSAIVHNWQGAGNLPRGNKNQLLQNTEYYQYAYNNQDLDAKYNLASASDLEYLNPTFCFKMNKFDEILKLVKVNNKYIIGECYNCKHEIFPIDLISSIELNKNIDVNKQKMLRDLYLNNLLNFTMFSYRKWFIFWVKTIGIDLLKNDFKKI